MALPVCRFVSSRCRELPALLLEGRFAGCATCPDDICRKKCARIRIELCERKLIRRIPRCLCRTSTRPVGGRSNFLLWMPCRIVQDHCNRSAPVRARHWSPRASEQSFRTAYDCCHERVLLPGAVRAQRPRSSDLCRIRDPRSLVPAATRKAQRVIPSVQYAACIMQSAATTCKHRPYDAHAAK